MTDFTSPRLRFLLNAAAAPMASLIITLLAWEVIAVLVQQPFFPPISEVFARLYDMLLSGEIHQKLLASLRNLAIGFTISLVFGLIIGIAMGRSKRIDAALDLFVYALITTPSLIFAPIFFAVYGLGPEPVIAVIVLYSIVFIIINTATAVREAPAELIEMARVFGASNRDILFNVRIPHSTPLIMAGIRVAATRAVKGMVTGEMFIAAIGLGSIIIQAGGRFDATTVLAILVLVIILAYIAMLIVDLIDRRLTSWLPNTARTRS
jgi:ABC-type nitrate/sulfonate/bicarbonate transport system permease component